MGTETGIDPNNPTAPARADAGTILGNHPQLLRLLQAMKAISGVVGKGAGNQQPISMPGQQGTSVQPTLPRQGGGAAPSMGSLPMPVPSPGRPGFSPEPSSAEMMAGLDPKGQAVYSGIQGVSKLLQDWTARKDQKEEAEAANIAQNLMAAMKNGDTATVHEILNDKHATKVLNKVYKGWLTRAEKAQEPQKQEKPDPAIQGFERGITQSAGGGGPQGQQPPNPNQVGGYQLPQAGPAQQLGDIKTRTELEAAQADPKRTLDSQLSSDEMRKAERAKLGLDSTPATDAKLQEIAAKLQSAQLSVKKAELELQTQQSKLQETGARASEASKKADLDLQKAQVQLDIEKTRLLLLKEKGPTGGGKQQQPPVSTIGKLKALEDAEAYAQNVLKTRPKGGFTTQDVQTLTGLLRQAGASSTAQSLPGWYGRNMPTWLGGKGEEDVAGMLETIQQLKSGIQDTIDARYPGWQSGGKKASAKAEEEDTSDQGDEVDADIVVSPEEMAGAKP